MAPTENGGGGYPKSLAPAGGEIRVDHEVMKEVAKKLQDDLDELKTSRLVEGIEDYSPTDKSIGTLEGGEMYSAGRGLKATVDAAETHITSTYSQFLAAYQSVIDAINRSEQNHRNADDNAAAAARARGRVD